MGSRSEHYKQNQNANTAKHRRTRGTFNFAINDLTLSLPPVSFGNWFYAVLVL